MTIIQRVIAGYGSKRIPVLGSFSVPNHYLYGGDFTINPPLSTSTGAWTYTSTDPTVISVNATTGVAKIIGTGSCMITAKQDATSNYESVSLSTSTNVLVPYAGVWSAAHQMSAARGYAASFGSRDDLMVSSGSFTGSVLTKTSTRFNGVTWSASVDVTWAAANYNIGAGLVNDGIAYQSSSKNLAKFNGTSYAAGPVSLNPHSTGGAGFGNSASSCALAAGAGSVISYTDIFNGTAWSAGSPMNNGSLYGNVGLGTLTDALSVGKYGGVGVAIVVERYNGVTWSTEASTNTGHMQLGSSGNPLLGAVFGGILNSVNSNVTEIFNGVSWSTSGNLPTYTHRVPGFGGVSLSSSLSAISAGGITGATVNNQVATFS